MNIRPLVVRVALMLAALTSWAQAADSEPPLVIEGMECRGNTSTSCAFILGYLYLAAGEPVDENEIQNAKLRLATLPNFKSVDVHLERGSARGHARIIVEVAEADAVFSEFLFGASSQQSQARLLAGARIGHQNVFGSGKLVDLTVIGQEPLDNLDSRGLSLRLRYADPHLFDSKAYYLIAGLRHSYSEFRSGFRGDYFELSSVTLALGRRLWDFSYLSLGYEYDDLSGYLSGQTFDSGLALRTPADAHIVNVLYGWNSEDDYYFPTHGSALSLSYARAIGFGYSIDSEFQYQFRRTWQTDAGSSWTLKINGEPSTDRREAIDESQLVSLMYARPIAGSDGFMDIRRGRWYVEPGFDDRSASRPGRGAKDIGLKLGIRLETATLGLVDFYLIGRTPWNKGD